VIPLFILMGNFATQGGISKALFEFAAALRWRASRAGWRWPRCWPARPSAPSAALRWPPRPPSPAWRCPRCAATATTGRLATGTLAAGGTLGILIPPSVPLVVYAILAEQNIAKLFAAAMIPGIIAMLGYMIAIAIYVRVVPGQAPERTMTTRRA
jgi:C4-dicarboxylate transporter DctM subunit